MVDSRQKGARAETAAKELLRKYTKLGWERTPGSGALNEKHKLKGDLYLPDCKNKFCVEVKHYKDDHLTSKVLTDKTPQLLIWWEQAVRQAEQVQRDPLLLFKFDRSKWFVCFTHFALSNSPVSSSVKTPSDNYRWIYYNGMYISKLEDWLENEEIIWIL